ncbi:phage baseplate assembly protein W [Paucibacter oligotrophus]|uniref:Phage baseplate assembly protein W n=1 Tax=Roseateles oligotrophus TaxID=1769250 RepID=A0A840L814_9BURK|nr:GPW/gp25 family protein [Roseateles oligotrophus]MBB4842913.1 phage baseplate assembly protein W [Roseateles oligotrophus]
MSQPQQNIQFPYHFDGRGRTAQATATEHVRELMEQVLFTAPGERVMRPEFGSGLAALLFEPNSSPLAAATQALVQAALQEHLSHLIAVHGVEVHNEEGALKVDVRYSLLRDRSLQTASLQAPGVSP